MQKEVGMTKVRNQSQTWNFENYTRKQLYTCKHYVILSYFMLVRLF